jgi:hypothetical protein
MRRACAATVGLVLAASPALADEPLGTATSRRLSGGDDRPGVILRGP